MNDQQRSVIHENMAKKLHAMCVACTNSIDIIEVFSVTGGLAELLPEELALLLDQVSGQAVRNMTTHIDGEKVERALPTKPYTPEPTPEPAPTPDYVPTPEPAHKHKPTVITAAPTEPEDELTTLKRERDEYAAWLDTLSSARLQKHIDETGVRASGSKEQKKEKLIYAKYGFRITHLAIQKAVRKPEPKPTPEPEYIPEPEVMAEFDAFLGETL